MGKNLWTRDFTILTLGSVVSMFGNAVSGFSMGLLVLDYTDSTLLYALFMVCYSLPRVAVPLLAGPYLDRFSRKKVIYSLDFFSAAFYGLMGLLLYRGVFSYPLLICLAVLVGSVDSVYSVAYDSLYPTLISEGNFTKAYSVSSLIYPLATTIMVPVAGICYNTIGLAPLFLFNAGTFLIAALFETRIRADESHLIRRDSERFDLRRYGADLREGLQYLRSEKGLMAITLYFFVSMLVMGVQSTLVLPFFRSHTFEVGEGFSRLLRFVKTDEGLGVGIYTLVMSFATVGRLAGGLIHYRFKYPVNRKFAIAIFVYSAICLLDGAYMYLPVAWMLIFNFLVGVLGVTSYNIRISSTQDYVEDAKRGRFNGAFQMLTMAGSILGQLIAGGLGEVFPPRAVVLAAMVLNLFAVAFIMYPNREHVKKIYNREA